MSSPPHPPRSDGHLLSRDRKAKCEARAILPPGLRVSVQKLLLLLLLVEGGPSKPGAGGWALVCSRVLAGCWPQFQILSCS